MQNMNQSVAVESFGVVLKSVVITAHVNKRAVSSELEHEAMTLTAVDPETDTRVVETHVSRRFERAAACPIATARALYEHTRAAHPKVPCELRFA